MTIKLPAGLEGKGFYFLLFHLENGSNWDPKSFRPTLPPNAEEKTGPPKVVSLTLLGAASFCEWHA